jgi:type II secretory pathway pseudopilin PulG
MFKLRPEQQTVSLADNRDAHAVTAIPSDGGEIIPDLHNQQENSYAGGPAFMSPTEALEMEQMNTPQKIIGTSNVLGLTPDTAQSARPNGMINAPTVPFTKGATPSHLQLFPPQIWTHSPSGSRPTTTTTTTTDSTHMTVNMTTMTTSTLHARTNTAGQQFALSPAIMKQPAAIPHVGVNQLTVRDNFDATPRLDYIKHDPMEATAHIMQIAPVDNIALTRALGLGPVPIGLHPAPLLNNTTTIQQQHQQVQQHPPHPQPSQQQQHPHPPHYSMQPPQSSPGYVGANDVASPVFSYPNAVHISFNVAPSSNGFSTLSTYSHVGMKQPQQQQQQQLLQPQTAKQLFVAEEAAPELDGGSTFRHSDVNPLSHMYDTNSTLGADMGSGVEFLREAEENAKQQQLMQQQLQQQQAQQCHPHGPTLTLPIRSVKPVHPIQLSTALTESHASPLSTRRGTIGQAHIAASNPTAHLPQSSQMPQPIYPNSQYPTKKRDSIGASGQPTSPHIPSDPNQLLAWDSYGLNPLRDPANLGIHTPAPGAITEREMMVTAHPAAATSGGAVSYGLESTDSGGIDGKKQQLNQLPEAHGSPPHIIQMDNERGIGGVERKLTVGQQVGNDVDHHFQVMEEELLEETSESRFLVGADMDVARQALNGGPDGGRKRLLAVRNSNQTVQGGDGGAGGGGGNADAPTTAGRGGGGAPEKNVAAAASSTTTSDNQYNNFSSSLKWFKYLLLLGGLRQQTSMLYIWYIRITVWGCTLLCLANITLQTKSYRNAFFDVTLVVMHFWVSMSFEKWRVFTKSHHWRLLVSIVSQSKTGNFFTHINQVGVFGLIAVVGAIIMVRLRCTHFFIFVHNIHG